MNDFKIGDRVRIIKKTNSGCWNPKMDKTIGKIGIITNSYGQYRNVSVNGGYAWSYHIGMLGNPVGEQLLLFEL